MIDEDGTVYGAAFDTELNVHHIGITSKEDLSKIRGSKYLQSDIENSFIDVKKDLENGKYVLFSGTPCQISGLKSFLGKAYDNLYTVDIICHGVPSSKVWHKYLDYCEDSSNSIIDKSIMPEFRNKDINWKQYQIKFKFVNGSTLADKHHDNLFMKAFLNDLCLRPSCYNCHSKSINRESDITLADFWGIEKIRPDFFDNKGTSLVLVNSEKGSRLFNNISNKMNYANVDIDIAVECNPSALKSADLPRNRNVFFKKIDEVSFDKAVNKCVKKQIFRRILRKIKRKVSF